MLTAKMEESAHALQSRCHDLIIKIGILNNERYASLPLARYISSIPCAIPIEHIILAERPYATNIFPYAASAMSYDPGLQAETTPMIHFLALDISNGSDLSYDTARDWFRDSWKYLNKGIVLLNVCTTFSFMNNNSERERVIMEEFIRDMLLVSLKLSNKKIHVYALGNPARHSAGRIRSSMVENRSRVTIHECKNPAGFKHRLGDRVSPDFTMGAKALTRLLANLIKTTINCETVLCNQDYFKMTTGNTDLTRLIEKGTSSSESFKAISAYFKVNTGKTVDRNDELFDRAAAEMKEFVMALSASKIKLLFAQVSEPQGTSKPSYFNSRPNYNSASYSKGSSSKASVHTPGKKHNVGFGDDDVSEKPSETSSAVDTRSPSVSQVSTPRVSTPQTPTPIRQPQSVAGQSSVSRRAISVGFADDDESDTKEDVIKEDDNKDGDIKEGDNESDDIKDSNDFDTKISSTELEDLGLVSDFIDPSGEKYDVEPAVVEFVQEAIRTKRAMSDVSREVLIIIRNAHRNPSQRSIGNALGYENGIEDIPSPIMQWILKNVSHSN